MSGLDFDSKCEDRLPDGAIRHAGEAELRGYAVPSRELGPLI